MGEYGFFLSLSKESSLKVVRKTAKIQYCVGFNGSFLSLSKESSLKDEILRDTGSFTNPKDLSISF